METFVTNILEDAMKARNVMIVGGPKDIGKSNGMDNFVSAATKLKYHVI